jgi:hypothetical protein
VSAIVPPTAVSAGTAVMLVTSAQLKLVPLTSVTCDPDVATVHAMTTGTGVVSCDWMAKEDDPAQVTLPSIAVPDNEMRYPVPAGMPLARKLTTLVFGMETEPLWTTVAALWGPVMTHWTTSIS